ncbi:hypothetical protein HEP_00353900 [Hepatocystis sp. ex Piliocolobus tephrosceles]|nr:hypothetical protein HEP_00353900 [Hepatocystis sp. ex Piliocolobus tephrosceles]
MRIFCVYYIIKNFFFFYLLTSCVQTIDMSDTNKDVLKKLNDNVGNGKKKKITIVVATLATLVPMLFIGLIWFTRLKKKSINNNTNPPPLVVPVENINDNPAPLVEPLVNNDENIVERNEHINFNNYYRVMLRLRDMSINVVEGG